MKIKYIRSDGSMIFSLELYFRWVVNLKVWLLNKKPIHWRDEDCKACDYQGDCDQQNECEYDGDGV